MDVRMCVVVLVLGGTYALKGTGPYCRDPDTGKLYPANSTWKSISFCGNYTCRLKKKEIPTEPFRKFKITDMDTTRTENKSTSIKDSGQDIIETKQNWDDKKIAVILNKIINNNTDSNAKNRAFNNEDDFNKTDRYLNEKEIKIISDLLHSVKKSDLEAVVDIYNIAQDIYKELDKKTSETSSEDTGSQTSKKGYDDNGSKHRLPKMGEHQLVYGFDSMHMSQKVLTEIKDQENELLTDAYPKLDNNELTDGYEPVQITNKSDKTVDMHKEGSDLVPLVYLTPKFEGTAQTYNSPITNPGYVKLPYYYDLSSFQRHASYIKPSLPVANTEKTIIANTEKVTIAKTKPFEKVSQDINKPVLLPYPYYQVRYNASGHPFNYFYGVNPYQDVYRKEYNPYYVTRTSYTDKIKTNERNFNSGSLIDTFLPKDDTRTPRTPDWKTESLSDDVIDDIRAHFENKNILFKPLCLKKKIKLEKVGKVFKFDDFSREKRSESSVAPVVNENDNNFETYVEKIICKSDVDPGFFRMGNATAPYPACCPQRITR